MGANEMQAKSWKIGVFAFAVSCLSCSGGRHTDDEGVESAAQADAGAVASTVASSGQDLAGIVDRMVAEAAKLPRAEFDAAALAQALGKSPVASFEWVRDRTSWAPYRGLLRGSQGVMIDRIGSSLDRSVLLGDLLRHAGYPVRLAHAKLPADRARALLERVPVMPRQRGTTARADAATAAARQLIRSQSDALISAVRSAAAPADDAMGASIDALRDHWWVEYEDGGKWIALDTLLSDSKPGESLVDASARSAWDPAHAFPSVPPEDWHSVHLRVVVERYEAGATTEFTVLEQSIRPADVLGKPVRLSHAPVPWPPGVLNHGADANRFREAAVAVNMWIPVLQVGDDMIVQSGYTNEGDLQSDVGGRQNELVSMGQKAASTMDIALGFSGEDPTAAASAEWIDYEIRAPGSKPRTFRRPVFDLLGPTRRAGKATDFQGAAELRKLERFEALWAQTDILLQTCEFTEEYLAELISSGIVAHGAELKRLADLKEPAKRHEQLAELLAQLEFWGPLPSLVLWRSALDEQSGDTYLDRVNVLHYRAGRSVLGGDPALYREQIDLASNPVALRRGAATSSFDAVLRQGVADTVSEMMALGNDLGMAGNTASVFGRLASQDIRGMLIAARDEDAARALPWPEDEMARVAADVNAGFMVVVPRQAVVLDDQQRVGWWRVHPITGETVGVMDDGFHATSLEGKVITIVVALAPILNNPLVAQRVDRIRMVVSHWGGRGLSMADMRLLAQADLYRLLMADLAVLAR